MKSPESFDHPQDPYEDQSVEGGKNAQGPEFNPEEINWDSFGKAVRAAVEDSKRNKADAYQLDEKDKSVKRNSRKK